MNLSQVVEREINRSTFISEAMQAGIINVSSLARYLQADIVEALRQPTSVAAIAMTIKRLPISPGIQIEKSITRFMKQLGDITVQSDLADFTFRNSPTLTHCQGNLLKYLDNDKSYFYSFCKGVHETTLICSESLSLEVKSIFCDEVTVMSRAGLAVVSIKLPPTNLDTYGVYYSILKQLAWKGINLVEMLSTSHEISLVISNEHVEEVFSIVLALKKGK